MAKEGRFAKKKKKSFAWLWILLIVLILGGLGWFFLSQMEFPPAGGPNQETTAPATENGQPEQTVPMEPGASESATLSLNAPYQAVLDRYSQAIAENWDMNKCREHKIGYLVTFLENLDGLGYYLTDLDDNGVAEMIVSDGTVIYDLYTQVDGQVVWVLSGAQSDSYFLCEDGTIFNQSAGEGNGQVWSYYRLAGNQAVLTEVLTFEIGNEGPVWSLKREGKDTPETVNESRASMIIASHKQTPITVTPIAE